MSPANAVMGPCLALGTVLFGIGSEIGLISDGEEILRSLDRLELIFFILLFRVAFGAFGRIKLLDWKTEYNRVILVVNENHKMLKLMINFL